MAQDAFNLPRWMALLLILMDGEGHTANELIKRLDCEQRNFFYVLRSMAQKKASASVRNKAIIIWSKTPSS